MEKFVDILEPRRRDISTVGYFLKEYRGKHTCKQDGPTDAESHKIAVLRSRKIQELVEGVSAENNVSKEEVERQIRELLEEIGYKRSLGVIRTLGVVLTKILLRMCSGVFVNEATLLQIKETMGHCPIVLVPTHRSYADFSLMSLVFYIYRIAIPTTAGGMDFQGMMGMGEVLRKTGGFFMRRSFANDKLYGTVFRQYVHQLVTKNDDPLQFFVEGTRSRTLKSLPPKFGLMLMSLKPFFTAEVPDIWFVPQNTTYDRVVEEKLFAFELLGVPKPKESTSGFIRSLRIVNENHGNVYINFGNPVSVKDWFSDKIVRDGHSLKPLHEQELTANEKKLVAKFAYEMVYRQERLSVITTFNLIALCLTDSIRKGSAPLTLDALLGEIEWIRTVLEAQGAITDVTEVKRNVLHSLDVHSNLVWLGANGEISLRVEKIVVDTRNKKLLKGHSLSEDTMTRAVPFVMLQVYVNPTLHFLLNPMLLALAVNRERNAWSGDGLLEHYLFFRALFFCEFVVFGEIREWEFGAAVNQANNLRVLTESENGVFKRGDNEKLIEVLCGLLDPFLECYHSVCSVLLEQADEKWTEKHVFAKTQAVLEKKLQQKDIFVHPYVLSLDAIKNCFTSLNEMKAIRKNTLNQSAVYTVHKENLSIISVRLSEFVRESQRSKVFVQLKNKL